LIECPGRLTEYQGSLIEGQGCLIIRSGCLIGCPGCLIGCPGRLIEHPGRLTVCPGRLTECPGRLIVCPGCLTECPGRLIECPGRLTECPGRYYAENARFFVLVGFFLRLGGNRARGCASIFLCVGIGSGDDSDFIYSFFIFLIMASYNSSQGELFSGMRLLVDTLDENLVSMGAFKSLYDAAYVTSVSGEIVGVETMPDLAARRAVYQVIGINMADQAEVCRRLFQRLKRYIETAFAENLWAVRFNEAGQGYYAKAGANDWESVKMLMLSTRNFVLTHSVALSAGGNMPAGFGAEVTAAGGSFVTMHTQFLAAREASELGTQAKEAACEALFSKGQQIMRDGKEMAVGNVALTNEFTWTQILLLLRGAGTAGVRGFATDLVTGLALAGVSVTVVGTEYSAVTDGLGRYEISPMAAGNYVIRFSREGYVDVDIPFTVETGTVSSLSTNMAEVV